MAVQRQRLGHVQRVGEHQPLGVGVDAQLLVVRQRLLAPFDRIARIVAQPVEELGEVQVEIGQERVHADHVGERDAQVAAVLLHPVLERRLLVVAQPHAGGLVGLQVLVRHRADRHQPQFLGQQHVGRAPEGLRQLVAQRAQHLLVPGAGETPAQAEVEELERVAARRLVADEGTDRLDLAPQPPPAFLDRRRGIEAPEVQLVDHRQHEDLEAHHMHLRAAHDDLEPLAVRAHRDEVALETEDAQQVDEVRLHEAQAAQVVQLVRPEGQRAQVVQFALEVGHQRRERVLRRVAAGEAVLGLRLRMPVQHRLPHRELVEVGLQQAADHRRRGVGTAHGRRLYRRLPAPAAGPHPGPASALTPALPRLHSSTRR